MKRIVRSLGLLFVFCLLNVSPWLAPAPTAQAVEAAGAARLGTPAADRGDLACQNAAGMAGPNAVTYSTATRTGQTIVTGTTNLGQSCDDCVTAVTLPFPVTFYGVQYTSAYASSNGNLQFDSSNAHWANYACLPDTLLGASILVYFGDLTTYSWNGDGIFTAVLGSAPHRRFVIEWRAHDALSDAAANQEIIFYEDSATISTIYGVNGDTGRNEEAGVQAGGSGPATAFSCWAANLPAGLAVDYIPATVAVDTTTSLAAAPATLPLGTTAYLTATVAKVGLSGTAVPTGTVTFRDGGTVVCPSVALDGAAQATCTLAAALPVGAHGLTADYAGNASWNPSTGTFTLTVAPPPIAAFTLVAQPDTLSANGLDTAVLTITAADAHGDGRFFAGRAVTLTWGLGFFTTPISVTLGAQGTVTYTYTAGTQAGLDTLTATIDDQGTPKVATAQVQLYAAPLAGTLTSRFGPVITYTLAVRNADVLSAQTHVVITGSIPADTELVSVVGGTQVSIGGDYGWGYVTSGELAQLEPGQSYTLTWTVRPMSIVGDIVVQGHGASDTAELRLGLANRVYRTLLMLVYRYAPALPRAAIAQPASRACRG